MSAITVIVSSKNPAAVSLFHEIWILKIPYSVTLTDTSQSVIWNSSFDAIGVKSKILVWFKYPRVGENILKFNKPLKIVSLKVELNATVSEWLTIIRGVPATKELIANTKLEEFAVRYQNVPFPAFRTLTSLYPFPNERLVLSDVFGVLPLNTLIVSLSQVSGIVKLIW